MCRHAEFPSGVRTDLISTTFILAASFGGAPLCLRILTVYYITSVLCTVLSPTLSLTHHALTFVGHIFHHHIVCAIIVDTGKLNQKCYEYNTLY